MAKTLEYRAAEYIGREDMPRRSAKLAQDVVLVVWDDPNVCALLYDERPARPHSVTFWLTPKRRAELAALFATSESEND